VCLQHELWLRGWPNLENAQVRLEVGMVLVGVGCIFCASGGPTVTDQSSNGAAISATPIRSGA